MNLLRRTASNIMLLMSGQVVTWISTLILAAAYGRFLGAKGSGELYLALTFAALIGFPIEFSFNQQIVRDVTRDLTSAHKYITMSLTLKAILWVFLFALAMLLTVILGYRDPSYTPEVKWLIAISGVSLLTMGISTALISIQTAYMQVGLAKFGAVIEKVIDCVLAVLLLRAGAGVIPVSLVLLFGSIAGMAYQIVRTIKLVGIRIDWDMSVARTLIRSGMSFLAYGVIGVIYYRIDTILLSVFATASAIGVYGAAYRLFDTLTFIPGIVVGAVMSPILAKYAVDTDKGKLRLAVEKSTIAMLLCSIPVAAGILVTAPNIIGFIYAREDFNGSVAVLQVLAVGLIALYLNSVLTTVLVSTGQERKLPLMAIVALIFNVALNFFLIPRYMDLGAAWATSLTELLLLGIGMWLIDRSLIPINLLAPAGKIMVAGCVMAAIAWALTPFNIMAIMPVAAVVYVVAILILRVLPADDMTHLGALFERYIPRPAIEATGRALTRIAPKFATVSATPVQVSPVESEMTVMSSQALSASDGAPPADDTDAYPMSPEISRLVARGEHSATGSVPLNVPVRVASGFIPPHQHASAKSLSVLQRQVQRRLAQLDAHQIATALERRQLGRFALRMQRIEWSWPAAQPATIRLNGAVIPLHSAPEEDDARQPLAGAGRLALTYYLAIERQRPQKRGKDGRSRHSQGEKHGGGYTGRSSRPLDIHATRRSQQVCDRPSSGPVQRPEVESPLEPVALASR